MLADGISTVDSHLSGIGEENEDMEIMLDYEKRETVILKELIPNWWGHERFAEAKRG